MVVTWQTLITFAAVIAAISAVMRYYNKGYDWVKRQDAQDKELASVKDEQTLVVYGLLACLKGLKEQGCDGPVTDAIDRIEKHLNKKAHE